MTCIAQDFLRRFETQNKKCGMKNAFLMGENNKQIFFILIVAYLSLLACELYIILNKTCSATSRINESVNLKYS